MIDILSTARAVLGENGYTTRLDRVADASVISFEDDSLMGRVFEFPEANSLVSLWESTESDFLRTNGNRFRLAGEKAWNVYCVFLTGADADEATTRTIRRIEENLDRTRKLAACAVSTKERLIDALLPVLAVQQKPALENESFEERLRRRLARTISPLAERAADEDADPTEIVKILRELR